MTHLPTSIFSASRRVSLFLLAIMLTFTMNATISQSVQCADAENVTEVKISLPEAVTKPILPENLAELRAPEDAEQGVIKRKDMVFTWLKPQIIAAEKKWRSDYEARKTPEQIAEYQKLRKQQFIDALGGFPERTPLNARITGTIQYEGYSVEKVIFESRPGMYVTGIFFKPDEKKFPKPWSGVVEACGHSGNGKGSDFYQRVAALHALNGIAAFLVDPIDQGERCQVLDPVTKKPLAATVHGHNLLGIGSILLGKNVATYEIWDLMRALDYMESRDDIRSDRLGMTGNSGGGTQTSYVMALDDRVVAASSCCYTCSLYGLMKTNNAQDAEQNIFGQAAFGMDHADYCMMRAPKATLLGTATHDFFPIDMAWQSFRDAKRLYQRLGYGEYVDLAENDNPHGFNKPLREATVRFMLRFLDKREAVVWEPENLKGGSDAEIQVTPDGQVLLLEGARTTYDFNRDYAKELATKRTAINAETLLKIREMAGVRDAETLGMPKCKSIEKVELTDGIVAEKMYFEPESRIYLPAILFRNTSATEKTDVMIYVTDKGKTAGYEENILPALKAGKSVLAVDLRGWGETQQVNGSYFRHANFGSDGNDYYLAYNLGRSYVGFRTDDLFSITRWLKSQAFCGEIELYAVSEACIPVLHAAVLDCDVYRHVTLENCLISWTNTVENGGFSNTPLTSTIHGVLKVYDLPEMRTYLESAGKLTVKSTKDAKIK
ncbi:MAG: prolyl oligopeptidase family serine peptidase [Planctomycetia bacterium]|nr:prolyl oligopeptidase family serine peptidase [Planctomycetia bacterium]